MELIKTKRIEMPPKDDDFFKENNAIGEAVAAQCINVGWAYVGMDDGDKNNNVLVFEKRIPVGDVINGMLRWIKAGKEMSNQTSMCRVCKHVWKRGEKEEHADDCPAEPFVEVFTDD